jgi:type VI secretion system secreted protein Hcp
MARAAYLTIVGAKQGAIKGDVTIKGKEGSIALFAFLSQIESPFDQASGLVTGKRQHRPIVIAKPIDQATPKLYRALVTNEALTDVTIEFWRPDAGGTERQYFTIKLTNATIVGITFTSPDTQDSTKATEVPYEEVRLTYQKIAWTWVDGGITAQDAWAAVA